MPIIEFLCLLLACGLMLLISLIFNKFCLFLSYLGLL